jgi:hypothetical protein
MLQLRLIVLLSFLFLFVPSSYSQLVKRTPCSIEINHAPIHARIHGNVFRDFGWLRPEVTGKKFSFSENSYFFMMSGSAFQLHKYDETMHLEGRGTASLVLKDSSNTTYYDIHALSRKPENIQKWIATQPGNWEWQSAPDSTLQIPTYSYYSFAVHDNMIVTVYEVKNAKGETDYFIQNSSYLMATNNKGINYILLDADCNGSFTDLSDKILFNSWNPYNHESTYKPIPGFKENTWYDQSYLYYTCFLNILYQNDKLTIRCENDHYADQTQTGTISFSKIPKKSTLLINDSPYTYTKKSFSLPAEFGMYKTTIIQKGYMNIETTFTLNETNPEEKIICPKAAPAGELLLRNIFSGHYFVTLYYPNGTHRIYYNTSTFILPPGEYQLAVNMDGYELPCRVKIFKNKMSEVDIKEELAKTSLH